MSGQDCDGAWGQAPIRSLLALPKALRVPPRLESTDQAEGMLPVSERVRPEPRWPGIHHRSLKSWPEQTGIPRWLPSLSAVDVWSTLDEAGGPFAPLDAAAVESSAADLERGGLPAWEARRLASVILGQVLHLADGTLPATREGIPRPAPAGSSPLSDRIGPDRAETLIFAVDGENPTR